MTGETKKLVLEMSVGILLWNLFLAVLGWFIGPMLGWSRLSMILGVLIGAAAAEMMLIHMAVIMERVLDSRDQSYANKTTVMHSMIRKFVYIVLLVLILWKFPQINPLAVVFGTMGLKAGAYLQPLLHHRKKKA